MSDSGKGVPGKKLDSHYMRLKNKKEKCQYCGVLMKHGSLVRHIIHIAEYFSLKYTITADRASECASCRSRGVVAESLSAVIGLNSAHQELKNNKKKCYSSTILKAAVFFSV